MDDARVVGIPQGWKLVPIEPSVVQANVGVDADDMRTGFETVKHIYRLMVANAPPAPDTPSNVACRLQQGAQPDQWACDCGFKALQDARPACIRKLESPPVVSRPPSALLAAAIKARKVLAAWIQGVQPAGPEVASAWYAIDYAITGAGVEPKRRIPMTAETFREILVPELEAMQANTEAAQEPDEAIGIARAIEFIRSIEIDGGKPYSDDAPKVSRP